MSHRIPNEAQPFWDGCRRGALLYQVCGDCGSVQPFPSVNCLRCRSGTLEWRESCRAGTIHAHTTVYRAPNEEFRARVPYVIALVDLDEGFRLMVNVLNCHPEDVTIGARIQVVFEARNGMVLPQAQLA